MSTETGVTSILGLESQTNKDVANGYAGLDESGKLKEASGAEMVANKDVVNGYAGLDNTGYIPIGRLSYFSIIPFGVSVAGFIPYMDDTLTYLNLWYLESGYALCFNDSTECFNMVKL